MTSPGVNAKVTGNQAMEKQKKEPECGFCHNGREVEDICGPLYTADECNAHKKCMQYSALLVQYRTKGFGGFKKRKVVEEMKRGRGLPCSICRNKKSKIKKRPPPKGATCGCAIKNCRRTYHYYCAHTNSKTVCRRIEVTDKNSSNSQVLYRVFCSAEHQMKFEKTQKKESEISYNSDSSATEYSSDEDDDQEDSPKRKKVQSKTAAEHPSNNKKEEVKADKAANHKQKRVSTEEPETPIKKAKSDDADETLVFTDSWESEKDQLSLGEMHLKTERLSSPGASPSKERPNLTRPGADLILCIMEDGKHLDKFGDRIRQMVAKQFDMAESSVYFWPSQGPHQISPQHMLYFMRDVAKAVYDSDTDTLARLIVRPIQANIEKNNHHIQFHDDYMDDELATHIHSRIRDVIGDYFLQKSKELGVDVGGGFILAELNSIFIGLPLGDHLDPNKIIRRQLPGPELVYLVEPSTRLDDPRRQQGLYNKERQVLMDKEQTALTQWLEREVGEPLKVRIRPKEIILRESNTQSTTCHMCNQFQRRSNSDSAAPPSVAMFIVPINGEVMAYAAYCKLAISSFVQEELTALSPIYCVLDVDDLEGFSKVEDILPPLSDTITVQAYSGLDPAESAISCVALKFFLQTI